VQDPGGRQAGRWQVQVNGRQQEAGTRRWQQAEQVQNGTRENGATQAGSKRRQAAAGECSGAGAA